MDDSLNIILSANPHHTEYTKSPDVTVITAIFDLSKRDPSRDRTIDDYLKLGHHLLDLNINLIVAGDEHILLKIWAYRRAKGLLDKTYLQVLNLENSPYYSYYPQIAQAHVLRHKLDKTDKNSHEYQKLLDLSQITGLKPAGLSVVKDSPLYTIIGWTRYHLCAKMAELNPFDSTHLAWIDFGIFHLYQNNINMIEYQKKLLIKSYNRLPTTKLKCMILRHTAPSEIIDKKSYFSQQRFKVAGGYLAGCNESMIWLGQQMELAIASMMDTGYTSLDEITLSSVIFQYQSRFDWYYGFYTNIIANSVEFMDGPENIKWHLNDCLQLELWDKIYDIGCYVLSSNTRNKKLKILCLNSMIEATNKLYWSTNMISTLEDYKTTI